MKFSYKLALSLSILLLCFSTSGALAQTTNINSVDSPTSVNLNSVFVINNTTDTNNNLNELDAWAVGDGGTILRWDGSSWTTVSSPTAQNLYSVFFVNSTFGWAVGGNSNSGVIVRYNNGEWTTFTRISYSGYTDHFDTVNNTLYSVTASSDGKVGWIVGANGLALNWNGDTWFAFKGVSPNNLRSVSMIHGSADAWAVGDGGTILHWTGTTWNTMTSPTNIALYTIQMASSTSGWAAGGDGSGNGVVLYLNGTTWSVWDNYLFGMEGTTESTLNATIYSISLGNATSAWACGSNGMVMYWSGNEWSCDSNLVSGDLNSVSMVHGSNVGSIQAWVVGDGGEIMAFNGTNWVPEFPLMAIPLILGIGLLIGIFGKAKLFRKTVLLK
ncbi:MAG: hypothetical protein NWE93_12380 [Candidatus Bathyarchaeota archaeon]|nr:hypothetical protein [Candidatus Bathyarchaeota archaeon]